jgi:hypothetical protein
MGLLLEVLERMMDFGEVLLLADRMDEIGDLFLRRSADCTKEEKERVDVWMERLMSDLGDSA